MSNLENANVKSAEERKRAEMHRTYGTETENRARVDFTYS